jgi:hypothetical protein
MFLLLLSTITSLTFSPTILKAADQQSPVTAPVMSIPDLLNFTFMPSENKNIPGRTQETNMRGGIREEDSIGRLGLVALYYQNNSYIDGRYNHNDFLVERGVVATGITGERFDAYRIHEPARKAQKFLGSQHGIFYRFPTREAWCIYKMQGSLVTRVAEIPAEKIEPERPTRIDGLTVSNIKGTATYFLAPARVKISSFSTLSDGTDGARIKRTPVGDIFKYRYSIKGKPADHSGQHTTSTRQFFLVEGAEHGIGIIWQDKQSKAIHLTRLSSNLTKPATFDLTTDGNELLIAACSAPDGSIFYATMAGEKGSSVLTVYRSDANGRLQVKSKPDTSVGKLNIFNFGNDMADMAWSRGKLALMVSRTMHKSPDGLNHQGGIAVIFDAENLHMLKNLGQTSGHSFDNLLTVNRSGEFIDLDLGDNYPRGIHLHRISEKGRSSKVVYTFKTLHGTTPANSAKTTFPPYTEISSEGHSFYKWSNDNQTYSQLGGLIQAGDGYVVVFSGEPGPDGRALDNSRTGKAVKDPRNIGLVRVISDFEKSKGRGSIVSDDLVLTKGIVESGGFYSFGGGWSEQRNSGIVWLTNYRDAATESATHIRAAGMDDGSILVMWEKMAGTTYLGSYAARFDSSGNALTAPFELGNQVRFHRRDNPLVIGNRVYIASGDAMEQKLELTVIDLNSTLKNVTP